MWGTKWVDECCCSALAGTWLELGILLFSGLEKQGLRQKQLLKGGLYEDFSRWVTGHAPTSKLVEDLNRLCSDPKVCRPRPSSVQENSIRQCFTYKSLGVLPNPMYHLT